MLHNPWFTQNDSAVFTTIDQLEVSFEGQALNVKSDESTAMGGYSLLLKIVEAFSGLYFSFVLQCVED